MPNDLHNRHHDRYAASEQDQQSLSEDIKLLAGRITALSQTLEGDSQQNFLKAVAALRDGKLNETADHAASVCSTRVP